MIFRPSTSCTMQVTSTGPSNKLLFGVNVISETLSFVYMSYISPPYGAPEYMGVKLGVSP
jgi:hypothetical protein